jgi:uncharacterized protein YodC (DUF2158 family)
MNAEKLKVGDVVTLKTMAPNMVVEVINHGFDIVTADCVWFEGKAVKRDAFPLAILKVVEG